MPHFDQFVERHGEIFTQAILENLERAEGTRTEQVMALSLEQRWHRLMNNTANQRIAA